MTHEAHPEITASVGGVFTPTGLHSEFAILGAALFCSASASGVEEYGIWKFTD